MNRREALKTGAIATAGAFMAPGLFGADHKHGFQVGACDWSIRRMLELDAFRMGQQLGLNGIQYSFAEKGKGWDLRTQENREAVRQIIQSTGVGIASLAIGLLNKIAFAKTDTGEKLVRECLHAMAKLKQEAAQLDDQMLARQAAPNVVLLAFFSEGDINGQPKLIEATIEKLKRVAPLAEKHGLTLGIESWLNEDDHRHILKSVDSPAVKVYYDVANANKMGYDVYEEIASLGRENICEIHCKENGFLLGEGRIDFKKLKEVINDIGYKDWLVIESAVPKGMDIVEAYRHNSQYIQTVFNA